MTVRYADPRNVYDLVTSSRTTFPALEPSSTRKTAGDRASSFLDQRGRFLDLLCESCQVGDLNAEGGGYASDGAPSWVSPGLNVAQPGRMEISMMGGLLLREAKSRSGLADRLPEGDLRIGSWSHARNGRGPSRP